MAQNNNLKRRTTELSGTIKRLSDNKFWLQIQDVLSEKLLLSKYDPSLYVNTYVGDDKEICEEILDFLSPNKDPFCFKIVGQYGVGKTTALKHFENQFVKKNRVAWIYIDCEDFQLEIVDDFKNFYKVIANTLSSFVFNNSTKEYFSEDILDNDPFFKQEKLLSQDYSSTLKKISKLLSSNNLISLNVYFRFLQRLQNFNRIVLVFDNVDTLDLTCQVKVVTLLSQLTKQTEIKGIITIRRETERNLKKQNKHLLGSMVRQEISFPSLTSIIKKRILKALDHPKANDVKLGEGALQFYLRDIPEFADVITNGLSHPQVEELLEGLSNQSIQEGLSLAVKIYASHFIDANKIIKKLSPTSQLVPELWTKIPYYIVSKAIILCNYPIYLPNPSKVPNIYGTDLSNSNLGPFLRLYIIKLINLSATKQCSVSKIKDDLSKSIKATNEQIDSEIEWLIDAELIESIENNTFKLTFKGNFFLITLIYDIEYLTHISTDVDMFINYESALIVPVTGANARINNLILLLKYLANCEYKLLSTLAKNSLNGYKDVFDSFTITPYTVLRIKSKVLSYLEVAHKKSDDTPYEYFEEIAQYALDQILKLEENEISKINSLLSKFSTH